MYSVKGMKSWRGRDGIGTQCWLCRNGVKVAEYTDEGNGGQAIFHWLDNAVPKVRVAGTDYRGEPCEVSMTPEEALLAKHIEGMTYEIAGHVGKKDAALFVAELCDAFETTKKMRSQLKKATWFRIKSETYAEGSWRVVKSPFIPAVKDFLVKKYGNDLGEILNETMAV